MPHNSSNEQTNGKSAQKRSRSPCGANLLLDEKSITFGSKLLDEFSNQPIAALNHALFKGMSMDVALAIISDPRCGLERRLTKDRDPQDGATPILASTSAGRVDITVALILLGADVSAEEVCGCTALHSVIRRDSFPRTLPYRRTNYLPYVKSILKSVGCDFVSDCVSQEQEILDVRLLIEKGARVDAVNDRGFTPLHLVGPFTRPTAVELLLTHGAPVCASTKCFDMPLHCAAMASGPAIVKLLLDNGASIDVKDGIGWTPLHHAASCRNAELVELLVAEGADLRVKDFIYNRTPLQTLLSSEYPPRGCESRMVSLLTEKKL